MEDLNSVERLLRRIDGRGYKAYSELRGLRIRCGYLEAGFTRVQGDPFATPSIMEAGVELSRLRIPSRYYEGDMSTPFTDYVSRRLYAETYGKRRKCGSGNSCYLGYPRPGPWIMKRSSVEIRRGRLILRISLGLPAAGRRILGREASALLGDACRAMIRSLELDEWMGELEKHLELYRDEEYLRSWAAENNYMFFIGDGSILPRETSLSTRPMSNAVPFASPPSLRREVRLPSGRRISGMAVPRGILVITGGGYHGKTTLLEAIQDGIYDHVRGDGREYAVSLRETMLVKAEDGRLVHSVDISSLISELPGGINTRSFSSMDASGSTSMAASISEAVELGAKVLLVDEDTSASNLLYKDSVMESLVPSDPIKQLSQLARSMAGRLGVGLVVISGASSAFLDPASHVIIMQNYVPRDATRRAKELAPSIASKNYAPPRRRLFKGFSGDPVFKARGSKIVAKFRSMVFELDTRNNPRIVEDAQVRMLAKILEALKHPRRPLYMDELARGIEASMSKLGFAAYAHPVPPDLAWIQGMDVAWAVNRMYGAIIEQES